MASVGEQAPSAPSVVAMSLAAAHVSYAVRLLAVGLEGERPPGSIPADTGTSNLTPGERGQLRLAGHVVSNLLEAFALVASAEPDARNVQRLAGVAQAVGNQEVG